MTLSNCAVLKRTICQLHSKNDNFPKYEVRKFRIPKLQFDATASWDMIEKELYELPLTMRLSDDQIKAFEKTPLSIPDYPNHTQAVE